MLPEQHHDPAWQDRTGARAGENRGVIFSANSHFIEPAHVFEGRMPRALADRAPRVIDYGDGGQAWTFAEQVRPLIQCTATAGIPQEQWSGRTVVRYEDIRKGCYDPHARLADMDRDGVDVAVCYSAYAGMGFGGDLFAHTDDLELAHASIRAFNDWMHEEWVAADPTRFVAVGVLSYRDPVEAAREVRRNAARGFKGVLFRNPLDLGLAWTGDPVWDPLFRACEETGTILVHHTNALEGWPARAPAGSVQPPYGSVSVPFQVSALDTVNSFLWAGIGHRFPGIRILISESGGSWLPHLIRRIDWALGWAPMFADGWPDPKVGPAEALARNFAFSTLEADQAKLIEKDHGISCWMLEDDYPHMESVWPETANHFARQLAGEPADFTERFLWRNGSELFRHPMPARRAIAAQQA